LSKHLKLISGNANIEFAQKVADYLHTSLVDTLVTRFSDGEIRVRTSSHT